jgi:alginate O-acetyltransferase complex protein AlgI
MVFSSHIFVFVFLPLTLVVYYLTPRPAKAVVLIAASFVFYGWWRPDFTVLMVISAVIDFVGGQLIGRAQDRGKTGKGWLVLALSLNLGLLGYFKYAGFAVSSLNSLLVATGGHPVSWVDVVLPVGISFYTFKTMSYTIDVYWKRVNRTDNFLNFLCYVTLFPELVAGPIVRYISIEKQLVSRTHTFGKFVQGIIAFQCGLAKKLLIADLLAPVADAAFSSTELTPAASWIGVIAYAFQIYFDFSGYSDMAIGLGLMFGFRFPINFDQPYRSASITEFWRRWHISLSTWLRDYLYVPLGGNRHGALRTYFNLIVTMLLGGLWHGANWTFVVWGAYQGIWLAIERMAGRRAIWASLPRPLQIAVTFVVALVGWVFFRAQSLGAALAYLGTMFDVTRVASGLASLDVRPIHVLVFAAAACVVFFVTTTQNVVKTMAPLRVLAMQPVFLVAILHLLYQQNVPFLYFQF